MLRGEPVLVGVGATNYQHIDELREVLGERASQLNDLARYGARHLFWQRSGTESDALERLLHELAWVLRNRVCEVVESTAKTRFEVLVVGWLASVLRMLMWVIAMMIMGRDAIADRAATAPFQVIKREKNPGNVCHVYVRT